MVEFLILVCNFKIDQVRDWNQFKFNIFIRKINKKFLLSYYLYYEVVIICKIIYKCSYVYRSGCVIFYQKNFLIDKNYEMWIKILEKILIEGIGDVSNKKVKILLLYIILG